MMNMLSHFKKGLLKIYAVAFMCVLIVIYLIYATVVDQIDDTYLLLTIERDNIVARLDRTEIGFTDGDGSGAILQPTNWVPVSQHYDSKEIYPVDEDTGESLFPSILTGDVSRTDIDSFSTSMVQTERVTKDHRGIWVFRVSGRELIGINNYIVIADVDVFEVIKELGIGFLMYFLLLLIMFFMVFKVRALQTAADVDSMKEILEDSLMNRILVSAIDVAEGHMVVADMVNPETGQNEVIYTSGNFERELGYERGETIGQPLEIFLSPDRKEIHRGYVAKFWRGEDHIPRRDVKPVNKQGEQIDVSLAVRRTAHVRGKRYLVASIRKRE